MVAVGDELFQDYYWGPNTATLDWCEENYQVFHLFAEFWNTTTNLLFVFLSLFGIYYVRKFNFERRFTLTFLGLLTVGIGSWLFHMTLQYSMQLLDELPMIYCSCFQFFAIYELDKKSKYGYKLPLALFTYSMLVTGIYLYNQNPIFHQVCYAFIVFLIVMKSIYEIHHLKRHPLYRDVKQLFLTSWVTFLFGFFLWNVDNVFCVNLRTIRSFYLPFPFDVLFQFHGWWHIFTCIGCYYSIVFCQALRQIKIGTHEQYLIHYNAGMFPVLKPRHLAKLH